MVKTITVTDEAYGILKKMKGENDSFSKVIIKVARERKTDLSRFLGILSKRDADDARKRVKNIREKLSKDIESRTNVLT